MKMKHFLLAGLAGWVALAALTVGCSSGAPSEISEVPMELRVYPVPEGYAGEIRQQLHVAMKDAVIGSVSRGPGESVIVVAPAPFHAGVERTIREFEKLGAPPPPPSPVKLRYWMVVGRPLGSRGAEGPIVVSGESPMREIERVLHRIADVEGPTEFRLLDRLELSSLEPSTAVAQGEHARIEQRTTSVDERVIAAIDVRMDANALSTRVVLEPGQFVVLGQSRFGGRPAHAFGNEGGDYATLYYVMTAES